MSNTKPTLAVIAATAVSIISFASLALPGDADAFSWPNVKQEIAQQKRQARDGDAFQAVSIGMPAADVLAKLGAPRSKQRFEATKTTAWDYRYQDPWGESSGFSVIVDDAGTVVGKARVRDSG